MNTLLWIGILVPAAILIYQAGATRNRMLINVYEHNLNDLHEELNHINACFEDVVDEWANACIVLDQVNRRLGSCMCGQRLSQKQEAVVMSVLIEASIVDPLEGEQ